MKSPCRLALVLWTSLLPCRADEPDAFARQNAAVKPDLAKLQYPVAIQPSFLKSDVSEPALGSKRTVFTPLQVTAGSAVPASGEHKAKTSSARKKEPAAVCFEPLAPGEWKKLAIGMDSWLQRAGEEMDPVLDKLAIAFVKKPGSNKVAYASLEWDHPLAPSLMLAPSFAKRFRETLGKTLLVAIPDQAHLMVFPGDGVELEADIVNLQLMFKNAGNPISCEFFLFRADGGSPRVLGTFAPEGD